MIKKIIIYGILALIIYGWYRVVQNTNYATARHGNVDRAVSDFSSMTGL